MEIDCCFCGGSGFDGKGTGYDNVCDHCGGERTILVETTETLNSMKDFNWYLNKITDLEITKEIIDSITDQNIKKIFVTLYNTVETGDNVVWQILRERLAGYLYNFAINTMY
ncbi:hypothetical protein NIES2100_05070 [Calothrix sp. NIES-2100]|uniref:hypothetical protein n=1 Tax=Calothrix sp. NIES-2100 TaxID=1954172 RepID=UPI000B5EC280|nr:hypothetical protein NIES2100_05070 [Calothrix sp. NIES-2100]